MAKAPKKKAGVKKATKPPFRTAAEATAWADSMQAQVKAGNRPGDSATMAQIEEARAFASRAAGG